MGGVGVTRLGRVGALSAPAHNKIANPSSRLCAWIDAGNSASYPGTGTAWNDISAQARAGTLNGSPAWASGVFTFDGIDDSNVMTPGGNIPIGSDPRTLMAVFQTTTTSASQDIWGCGDNVGDARRTALFVHTTGQIGVETRNAAVVTSATISANTWYCLTAVQTGPNVHDFTLYVNGSAVSSSTIGTNTALVTVNNNLIAGFVPGASGAGVLSGKFGICKLWACRLSAGQVDHEFQIIRSRFGL